MTFCRWGHLPIAQGFVEIGNEIVSTAIGPLTLIQVGQLSVTDEAMCTEYWLTA